MQFHNPAVLTLFKRAEDRGETTMGRPMTYHEAKAALKKRGPGAGLEDLMETLMKAATDELRAATKAAPPKATPPDDGRPLGVRANRLLEDMGENERAQNPKLTREAAIAKAAETDTGRRMREIIVDAIRKGEPTLPAEVVKAAPPSTVSKAVRDEASAIAKRAVSEPDPFERERLMQRLTDLLPKE